MTNTIQRYIYYVHGWVYFYLLLLSFLIKVKHCIQRLRRSMCEIFYVRLRIVKQIPEKKNAKKGKLGYSREYFPLFDAPIGDVALVDTDHARGSNTAQRRHPCICSLIDQRQGPITSLRLLFRCQNKKNDWTRKEVNNIATKR